jgi:hypothetical protein
MAARTAAALPQFRHRTCGDSGGRFRRRYGDAAVWSLFVLMMRMSGRDAEQGAETAAGAANDATEIVAVAETQLGWLARRLARTLRRYKTRNPLCHNIFDHCSER